MSDTIVWQDAYAIGHETLDAQHKELFRLAAIVLEIDDPIEQKKELRAVLFELYDYMRYHFTDEEDVMRELGYPELEQHQGLHQELVNAMNDIMRASTDLIQLEMNLTDLMNRWLIEHIATEDRKIAEWQRLQAHEPADGSQHPVTAEAEPD